jgi:hypothetical protein
MIAQGKARIRERAALGQHLADPTAICEAARLSSVALAKVEKRKSNLRTIWTQIPLTARNTAHSPHCLCLSLR